tara:strand:+ start:1948 stop:2106 length:159 start_codon:yes stop_codon:yes gene_type:complete
MSEKEAVLSDRLSAMQHTLREQKTMLEGSMRKTDRMAERMIDLIDLNKVFRN